MSETQPEAAPARPAIIRRRRHQPPPKPRPKPAKPLPDGSHGACARFLAHWDFHSDAEVAMHVVRRTGQAQGQVQFWRLLQEARQLLVAEGYR